MIDRFSYAEVLSERYPNVVFKALGDGTDYAGLVWQGGDPIPPKDQLDLDVLELTRQRAWRAIQTFRDDRIQNGGVRVGANWFHSDNVSRIQQLGLLMMGASLPPTLMWKTMGGNFVQMTPLLAQQIFQASAVSDQTIHAIAEIHRQNVMASNTPENYNWLTTPPAWPKIFGEP